MLLSKTAFRWALVAASTAAMPALAASLSGRIPAADGGWDIVSVDAATQRLFVGRPDGVLMVDLKTGHPTDRFVAGDGVHEAMVAPGTGRGISTNGRSNSATIWDSMTGAVVGEVSVGKKPDAEVWDPASKLAWVMNAGDGSASLVDLAAGKVVGNVPIGGSLDYAAVDGKGHLWVNVEDKNEVVEIDTRVRKVLRHIPLAGCDEPTGIALTAKGALISSCANGVAKVTDAKTGKALPDIAIGPRPDAVILDGQRSRAYVPSGGDGTLTAIDVSGATPKRIDQIKTTPGARTGDVDPVSGKVYLPSASYGPPAAAGERPKMLPGSFALLVVTP